MTGLMTRNDNGGGAEESSNTTEDGRQTLKQSRGKGKENGEREEENSIPPPLENPQEAWKTSQRRFSFSAREMEELLSLEKREADPIATHLIVKAMMLSLH